MSTVILSHRAHPEVISYLRSQSHTLKILPDDPRYGPGVEAHPDLRLCKMGVNGPAICSPSAPALPSYPQNASMCALVLDGFLIHRLDITSPLILKYCRDRRFREINVRQGYTRCSVCVVDDGGLITADPGIYSALSGVPGLQVLLIREGFVSLPGFPSGFIGGASGRVGDELIFNGDLSRHPDFGTIVSFVRSRGVKLRYFPGLELTDIGSIILIQERDT